MKKLGLLVLIVLLACVISGCGVQIKQDGNKIFTDADKDTIYKYAASALEKEGYVVKERSREDGVINTVPAKDNELFAEIKDDPKVNVTVKERAAENDVMVEITALISGDVDEKQSTLVARKAVDRLIEELNKYGMFTAAQEGSVSLPAVDTEKFLAYVETALNGKGYSVSKTDTVVEGKESAAASEYNEPLNVKVEATSQGTQVSVALKTSIEGNYDRQGNEQKAKSALDELTAVVEAYPVVEKSTQHTFNFVSVGTAYVWSKSTLDTLGYIIDSEDAANKTVITSKDGLKVILAVSDAGDNATAVKITASGEGGTDKAALESAADQVLTAINDELTLYQVSKTDSKMFSSTPLDKAYAYAKNALAAANYQISKADRGKYLVLGLKAGKPLETACVVNSLGNEGIAVEVTSYVNGKKMGQAEAEELAASEVARVIKYLGRYDKIDVK